MALADTYQEVYEILSLMDKMSVMKIPTHILKLIKEERNSEYKTKIDKSDIFNEKNVSKEAIDILCYLDYNYWMSEEKKSEVDNINKIQFQESEKRKREKYNPNVIFENKKVNVNNLKNEEIINIEKKSTLSSILDKIKNIFKSIF